MKQIYVCPIDGLYTPLRFLRFMRNTFGKSKLEVRRSKQGWTRHSYIIESSGITWSYYLIKYDAKNEAYIKIFGDKAGEVERIILEEVGKKL